MSVIALFYKRGMSRTFFSKAERIGPSEGICRSLTVMACLRLSGRRAERLYQQLDMLQYLRRQARRELLAGIALHLR